MERKAHCNPNIVAVDWQMAGGVRFGLGIISKKSLKRVFQALFSPDMSCIYKFIRKISVFPENVLSFFLSLRYNVNIQPSYI